VPDKEHPRLGRKGRSAEIADGEAGEDEGGAGAQ
jgi:hypothetical protein